MNDKVKEIKVAGEKKIEWRLNVLAFSGSIQFIYI